MADYALTGKKGTGKSKNAVRILRSYLREGKTVATNLDLNLSAMFGSYSKRFYVRLPDKPSAFDLLAVGHGNPHSYDEDLNGALVLDEMATWLNTRTFADKGRADMLDFLAHGRKYGWDAYYIMQDVGQVDKQLRESFIEYTVRHRRYDKVKIPLIGGLLNTLFGGKVGYLPRFHRANVTIGTNPQDLKTDSYTFRGDDLHVCYDTRQVFRPDYPHGAHSVLSPWHVEGRFLSPPPRPFLLHLLDYLRGKPIPRPRPRPVRPIDPEILAFRESLRGLPAHEQVYRFSSFLRDFDCRGGASAAGSPALAGRMAARSAD